MRVAVISTLFHHPLFIKLVVAVDDKQAELEITRRMLVFGKLKWNVEGDEEICKAVDSFVKTHTIHLCIFHSDKCLEQFKKQLIAHLKMLL